VGMMAFIGDIPHSPLDPASALPTQIFMWARNPEPGFIANAAAGIIVLLAFIIFMNMIAIILRRKFEQRW
nr:phosphate ABC transporter, permease protein PstA [Alphaproteobacteria bacterium]